MENLNAVVTGGTRGIGLAISKSLARRGASVALIYSSNEKNAEKALDQVRRIKSIGASIIALRGDVSDAAVVAENYAFVRKELGPVHILVNNAGIMPALSYSDITVEDWNRTMAVNLNGAFYWSKHVVPDMKAEAFGRIVNISSIAARGGGIVGPHYAASKAGMLGLTRYAAKELGPFGITVNAIAPAFIEDAGIFTEWSDKEKEKLRQKVSVPRIGNTGDVVRAFEYLIDSPFVTGVTLDVNGGTFMI